MASLLRKVEPWPGPEAMSDAEAAGVEENPSETKQFLDQGISDANKEYESALQTSEWRQEVGEDGKLLRLIGRMPFSFGDQYVVADSIETTGDGELVAQRIGIPLMEPVSMFQFDPDGEAFLPSCNLVEAEGRFNLSTSSKELASEGPVVWTYFNKGNDRLVRAVESGWHVFVERDGSATLNRLMSDTVTWQLPEPMEFPRDRVEQVPEVVDQHLSMVHEFLSEFKVDPKTASPLQTGTDVDTNFVAMSDPSVVELSDPNQVSLSTLFDLFQMGSELIPNVDDVANGALRRAGAAWENFAEVAQALFGQPTVDSSEEAQQRYAQARQADNLQQLGFVAVVSVVVVSLALMLGKVWIHLVRKEQAQLANNTPEALRIEGTLVRLEGTVGASNLQILRKTGGQFAITFVLGGNLTAFSAAELLAMGPWAILSVWWFMHNAGSGVPLWQVARDLQTDARPAANAAGNAVANLPGFQWVLGNGQGGGQTAVVNAGRTAQPRPGNLRRFNFRQDADPAPAPAPAPPPAVAPAPAPPPAPAPAPPPPPAPAPAPAPPPAVAPIPAPPSRFQQAGPRPQPGPGQTAEQVANEIEELLGRFGVELEKPNPSAATLVGLIDNLKQYGKHTAVDLSGETLNTAVLLAEHFAKHKVDLAKVFYRAVRGLSGNDSTDPIGGPTQPSTFQLLLRVIHDFRNNKDHEETVQLAMIYAGLVRSRIVDQTSSPEARFREITTRTLDFPENKLPTVGDFLTELRSNKPENTVKFPFSDLTTQTFFEGLFRSATTAERNAKALYIALQKQRLLGDPDLWFLEDQDARYVSEIARVVREKIDELRHKSGSGNDERSLLPGTELEGTLQFKGTPVMQWKARFGKRGLVAYVYAAEVSASNAATRAQNPDDATASHFGVEKAAGKWVAVKQLEKNLPAGENNRTLDTVLLQAAKLQFTDALRRMRQAFRRGDYYFGIDQPELPAPPATPTAPAPAPQRDSPTGQTTSDTQASLDALLASHAAATDRMRSYLEEL